MSNSDSDRTAATRSIGYLPAPPSRFIGREREIEDVTRLLLSSRLLTLTGPGGCGKTRLALAAARDLPAFEHGAWFVDLGGLDDAALVPQAVAIVLNLPEARGRSLTETLVDYLHSKQLLLILDNCEHLLAACAALAQRLLDHCPDVQMLATSREPLNIADEIAWLVPSLSLPDPDSPLSQLSGFEAIQLFIARAGEALPGFNLDERNAAIIVQICQRLDGIPLAIELAAARVKLLDVAQIAARLDDSLQLLTRGQPSAVPRHHTLRAALDWSYHLLQPRERALFRRLAVFAGGCTLEDVEAVCVDDPSLGEQTAEDDLLRAVDILDLLSELMEKSLITIAERVSGIAVHYRLLEPIRQYALEQLQQAGEEEALRQRHLTYFIQFAEQAEPQLKSAHQMQWLQRFDKEHDNLRAALGWGLQRPVHTVTVLRLAKALHLFWQRRGYWSEGRRWLGEAIAYYDAHTDLQLPGARLYLARAIVALEWLAVNRGDFDTAQQNLERGLALAEAANDPQTMSYAWGLLSSVSLVGDTSAAYRQSEASLDCARRSGDRWTLALADHVQGRVLYRGGEVVAARAALVRSEKLFRETGDKWSVAAVIAARAAITEEIDAARALHEEVLAIFQEFGHREQQIVAASNLAGLALIQGDTARAESLFEQVLTEARELQARATIAFCLRGLGRLRILQGDFNAAESLLREGMALNKETGHQIWFALSLAGLGHIAAARGQTTQAARVMGAVEAHLQANSINLDTDDQAELDQHRTAVRSALTHETFTAAYAAGQTLTLEQALRDLAVPEQVEGGATPPAAPTVPALRVFALGTMRVLHDEQLLTTWPFAKVKELLFYLISQPPRTKAQLGLALWPDASAAQLRNSLSTTLYHLRRVLGSPDWIIFEDDEYRFNRARAFWFDVDVFEAQLVEAGRLYASTPDRAIALLQAALNLYQGDFVEDLLEGEWFLLRREELRRKYLDALLELGQLFFARADYARAADSYRRAIEKDEVLEEAHRELMRCYARLGERGQALRHYQAFEQLMRDELGSSPAAESAALYQRLKRGEEV